MNSARPIEAISACWPLARCSGWNTQRLEATPQNAAADAPKISATARIVAGACVTVSIAPSAAA